MFHHGRMTLLHRNTNLQRNQGSLPGAGTKPQEQFQVQVGMKMELPGFAANNCWLYHKVLGAMCSIAWELLHAFSKVRYPGGVGTSTSRLSLPPTLKHGYIVAPAARKVDMLRRCIHGMNANKALVFMNFQKRLQDTVHKLAAKNMEVCP